MESEIRTSSAARAATVEFVRPRQRRRAIAAALLPLCDYVQRHRRRLLPANNRPIRIGRVRVRLPGVQRHRLSATGQFRRITISKRHFYLAATFYSEQGVTVPSKRVTAQSKLRLDGFGRLAFKIAVGVGGQPGAIKRGPI